MNKTKECLKRIGSNVKKYKIIDLDGKDEVTIGRSPDVTVCIMSVRISRFHAILKKTNTGAWTIKDNKSLNGVFVNDVKLTPLEAHELCEGDVVHFGVGTEPDTPPEFLYKYYKSLVVKCVRKPDDMVDGGPELKKFKTETEVPGTSKSEVKIEQKDEAEVSSLNLHLGALPSPKGNPSPSKHNTAYQQYRKKLDEQETKATAKVAEFEAKLKEMQRLLQEKESAQKEMAEELKEEKLKRERQAQMVESLKQKEEELKEELEKKQEFLLKEKQEMEEKMREELDDLLQVKEASLLEGLENQRRKLLDEKREVEDKLKKELESEREKDKKLSEELLLQKQKLEKVIEQKEVEKRLLESQLSEQVKDKKDTEVLQVKEEILSNFAELMETELQCSICNELFVKAVTLNCSHGFCWLCINQWMKVKKECPQCRAPISSHMRSIVLDSYIAKMVEQFSGDMKSKRQELIEERKKEEAAFEEANKPKAPPPARGRGRRGRGRGRGRRNNAAEPPPTTSLIPNTSNPIVIQDEEEEDDDDDEVDGETYLSLSDSSHDSDSDVVSGDEDVYFGGYGRCFSCGMRGHWANGCPFR